MSTKQDRNPFWFENVEERPHPWPGLTWLTPMLFVPDVSQAAKFYERVFGFVPIYENMPGTMIRLRYRGINFTINKEGVDVHVGVSPLTSGQTAPFTFYLYVDSVDTTLAAALENGCTLKEGPLNTPWGDKRARVTDPFGDIWDIASRLEK